MKKIVFISNNGYQRETRSDQLLEHLAFLLARLAVRLNGTPQSILKVFIVTGLLLAAHKKNELTLSKDKLFNKFQKRKKLLIHQRLSTHTSPDVISQELIREHNIQVSESTIYRYIYDDRVLNNGLLLLMKRQSLVILKLIRLWVVTTNLIY